MQRCAAVALTRLAVADYIAAPTVVVAARTYSSASKSGKGAARRTKEKASDMAETVKDKVMGSDKRTRGTGGLGAMPRREKKQMEDNLPHAL
jgi:hypothetical protein